MWRSFLHLGETSCLHFTCITPSKSSLSLLTSWSKTYPRQSITITISLHRKLLSTSSILPIYQTHQFRAYFPQTLRHFLVIRNRAGSDRFLMRVIFPCDTLH